MDSVTSSALDAVTPVLEPSIGTVLHEMLISWALRLSPSARKSTKKYFLKINSV